MSEGASKGGGCQLYLVSPPALEPAAFRPLLEAALDAGPVAAFQLRLKGAPPDAVERAVASLQPTVQRRGVAFVLNDDPALAKRLGCDGVHVGADDPPYAEARRAVGAEAIVGVSCYASRHLAMEAAEAGASYVAFGAFFPTRTKVPPALAELEIVAWWAEMMNVPCVAIGGITPENCRPLVQAGADFLAVSGGVWADPDGAAAAVGRFAAALA